MRYLAHWSNGCWKVFDRTKFADVATRGTQRDAEEAAVEFNVYEAKSRRIPFRQR